MDDSPTRSLNTPWVLASSNTGKLAELTRLLSPLGIELVSQASLGIESPAEPFHSFLENALHKARHASRAAQAPALADDSGLMVAGLSGGPGVFSSAHDVEWLLSALESRGEGVDRRAQFVCVIVVVRHAEDPMPLVAQGFWRGEIAHAPRGLHGFGYDPIFVDLKSRKTAAELSPEEKDAISHRGMALGSLRRLLERAGASE